MFSRGMCLVFLVTVVEIILNFGRVYSDSNIWVELAEKGTSPVPDFFIAIRFMLPYLASPLVPILGPRSAFGLLNSIFWLGGVVVAYCIGANLLGKTGGLLSALFFTTSIPMIAYGASVLTDTAGYFFVGLGLMLALKGENVRKNLTNFLEGGVLALGGFFHPTGFLSLLFVLICRVKQKRTMIETLAGVLTVILLGVVGAYVKGWIHLVGPGLNSLLSPSRFLASKLGLSLIEAITVAFSIDAQILVPDFTNATVPSYLLRRVSVYHFTFCYSPALNLLWLSLIIGLGWRVTPRKVTLVGYLVILTVFLVMSPARALFERYLFYLWPCVIPFIIAGTKKLAELPASIVTRILLKIGVAELRMTALTDPCLYATAYIVLQGIGNTLRILTYLGPSLPLT